MADWDKTPQQWYDEHAADPNNAVMRGMVDDGGGAPRYVNATPAEREARLRSMAQESYDRAQRAKAESDFQVIKQQFIDGRADLVADLALVNQRIASNTPLTAAEIRIGHRDELRALIWIADRIADGTLVVRKNGS